MTTPATILTPGRRGYTYRAAMIDTLHALVTEYGLAYVAHYTGITTGSLRSIRDRPTPTVSTRAADAIESMWDDHQNGRIPVAHIPKTRNANGEVYCQIEGDLIKALFALTNEYGRNITAELCESFTPQFVYQVLTGKYERMTVTNAANILETRQAQLEGNIEIVEVAA